MIYKCLRFSPCRLPTVCFWVALCFGVSVAWAQERVTGKVISSEDEEGLPGVNVMIKDTSQGTVTDPSGNYSLTVTDRNAILVFSSIGYLSVEVSVAGQTTVNVTLRPDVTELSEIVVVGYGTVKKSDVTGALSSVSAEQLQSVPVQSISQALQGRAAGVDVSMSNFRPGENPTIRIRGNRSLKATNDPLYVVDGIPLAEGAGINDFNPSDIQSIEVLKDASATAIYGSRGANGVILVTTKRGQTGKPVVTYDGYVGVSSPQATIDMMTGAQYAELKREAYRNNNAKTYSAPYADPNADFELFKQDPYMWESVALGYTWQDKENRIPEYRAVTAREQENFQAYYEQDLLRYANSPAVLASLTDPESITEIPVFDARKVRNTNWPDHVLRTGVKQSHQLSVGGGTEAIRAKFSVGYYDEQGIQENQGYTRYNVSLNLDYQVSKKVRLGAMVNGSTADQQYGGGTDLYTRALGQLPIAVPYDDQGNLIYQPGGDALIFNPIFDIKNAIDDRKINRLFGSFYGDVTLAKGLRYRINFGPDYRQFRRGRYFSSNTTERNRGTSKAYVDNDQRMTYVLENLLYYDRTFANGHTLGVTLLQSIQDERYEKSYIEVSNIPNDASLYHNIGLSIADSPDAYGTDLTRRKLMSWMGRVNYTLEDKYILTATGRFDGSSVLAPGNKWDFFPSFAVAWKVHQEAFMAGLEVFDELKVRAGYGKTGNSAVEPYSTSGSLAKTRALLNNTAAYGFRPDQLPNPSLKWENTAQVDVGIDFSLLGGRLSGSLDLYHQRTSDLIMDRQLPTVSGFGVIQENVGKTRNRGIEVSLSSVNIDMPGSFQWRTDVIFAKNDEAITELYGGTQDDVGNRWFIGHPITVFYDLKPIGVWQSDEVEEANAYNTIPGAGKFYDKNNDQRITTADDRVIRGSTVPDWTGSLVNTFTYKQLELSVFLYTRQGQTIGSGTYRPALAGRYTEAQLVNYWTPANPSNAFPRPTSNQERLPNPESYLYRDGSFVKLRQVTLTYRLPLDLLSRYSIQNLSVYCTAYNPVLWTDFKAGDPEFVPLPIGATNPLNNDRIDRVDDQLVGNNLSEKSFVLGVRASF